MNYSRLAYATVLGLVLFASGCGSQKGKTVFTAGPNSGTNVGTAPQDGTYLLYTAMSPNPTVTVKLKEGDKLGFQKTSDGRIEAVYDDKTYDFDKGTAQAYWKVE
ncbi:MAG TPA: hypothetical protein VGI81_22295 [Tepidisphaeraceae bacterium]|jgi:hypothetical protein